MKSLQKFWISFFVIIAAVFGLFGFAGCTKSNEEKGLKYTLSEDGSFYTVRGVGYN